MSHRLQVFLIYIIGICIVIFIAFFKMQREIINFAKDAESKVIKQLNQNGKTHLKIHCEGFTYNKSICLISSQNSISLEGYIVIDEQVYSDFSFTNKN